MRRPRTWEPLPAGDTEGTRALHELLVAAHAMHASLDLQETLDAITERIAAAIGFKVVAINIVRADGSYEAVAVHGDDARDTILGTSLTGEAWEAMFAGSRRWRDLHFLHHDDPAAAIDPTEPYWIPEIEASDDPNRWHPLDMMLVRLTDSAGAPIGSLSIDDPIDGLLPDRIQCEILELFAHYASVAIERAMVHEAMFAKTAALEWAATHDRLTGLRDRSIFDAEVPQLAGQPGRELAVLVIDLDEFKQLNDTAGHVVGDEVLRTVAERMQVAVRADDLIARTGGDEFVVVASAIDGAATAAALRERLKAAVEVPIRVCGDEFQIRASVGTAAGATPVDHEHLIAIADEAMYREKQAT